MLYVRSGCGRAAFSFHTALHPGNERAVDKQSGNTTESLTEHLNHWGANYVSKCALGEAEEEIPVSFVKSRRVNGHMVVKGEGFLCDVKGLLNKPVPLVC